ncbi:NAD(P)/FAD-dependent oxidoreductase [Blastococcus sp. Marseille-P5729]|uniref:flavin-containing monooxygenase n=1 Tax=Blastococcus sp. Marseille-P5729 TaxID=2086582 RepID=UPI0018FEE378|nr:NAD(P)/FAD-dependent oxidoreductase [Blastococcus sp. Marseille-P5729]
MPDQRTDVLDVLIVGGGFSGLYELDRLRDLGFSVKVWDSAGDFGGTWWWNCYPGARTDSTGQVYQFEYKDLWKDYDFKELYPGWEGVRDYLNYVDSKLGLRKDVEFSTLAETATWDEDARTWTVTSSEGKQQRANQLILATGFASKPYYPNLKGMDTFAGECHHTARWPQDGLDMTGKKVVVMGTGASGVQTIQEAGAVATQVTVFQRTPNIAIPMQQRQLSAADNDELRKGMPNRFDIRMNAFAGFDMDFLPESALEVSDEEREATYEQMFQEGGFRPWLGSYHDLLTDEAAGRTFYDFWRRKVHARMKNKEKAELLAPEQPPHPWGVKRPCLEQNYFEICDQDNVEIIDSNFDPIVEVVPDGVITKSGRKIEADVLVLATGFDSNRGGIMAIDITGVGGKKLAEKWETRVDTVQGLSSEGFPNLMFLYGPQSPSGFCNGPTSAELQGEMVADFLAWVKVKGYTRFENTRDAEVEWTKHLDEIFEASLFPKARSWYWGGNVPGKPAQMLNYCGGLEIYKAAWRERKEHGYAGYEFS